jgi:hypothetical protein
MHAVNVFFVRSFNDRKPVQLPLVLHAPDLFGRLILYLISCELIPLRLELYLPFRSQVQCADAMKQAIFPLSLIPVRSRVELDANSIGLVVFEVALVISVNVILLSEAMASVFYKMALVLSAIRPSVGPLSIEISIY